MPAAHAPHNSVPPQFLPVPARPPPQQNPMHHPCVPFIKPTESPAVPLPSRRHEGNHIVLFRNAPGAYHRWSHPQAELKGTSQGASLAPAPHHPNLQDAVSSQVLTFRNSAVLVIPPSRVFC